MLLLSSARNGSSSSICIRCTYRLQLQALQQKRLSSSRQANRAKRRDGDSGDGKDLLRDPESQPTYDVFKDMPKDVPDTGPFVRNPRAKNLFRRYASGKKEEFRPALLSALDDAKKHLQKAPVLEQVAKEKHEWDGASGRELGFNSLWRSFTSLIMQGGAETASLGASTYNGQLLPAKDSRNIYNDLAEAFRTRGKSYLEDRIRYHFYGHVTGSRFSESDVRNQQALADLRFPTEWYPATRILRRKIHLHVGPTNSGKTYQALQELERATTGAYGGPLRLLAHEIYSRLNAKGKKCSLVTGEEKRLPPGADVADLGSFDMQACTVEMLPQNKTLDVCVLDEIQMIGSPDRGWAWTQALLGVKAREVHLCGEERTVPLIKEICASVGEELTIHHYQRLSPLAVAEESLDGDLRKLRKGDCIVSFSVMGIHALRKQVEQATNRKVATVYGSLPPETRAQQARLFNDPNNDYDFLVASDAVGMGLNLAIKRIIFESSTKFNGITRQTLSVADVKQIGGRAGRFRIAGQTVESTASVEQLAAAKGEPIPDDTVVAPAAVVNSDQTRMDQAKDASEESLGLVTTLERFDYPIVRSAMESEPEPIVSAGLYPPAAILERFAGYFPPGTPFSYILTRLHELSQVHSRFHLCGLKDQVYIADLIEGVQGLTIEDRHVFTNCPASKQDNDMWIELMPVLAKCVATQSGGNLADIKELPLEILEGETKKGKDYLRSLERLHKGLVAYLWLGYRFAGIFTTRAMAQRAKRLVEDKIEETLSRFSFSEAHRRKLAQLREKALLEGMMKGQGEGGDTETAPVEGVAAAEDAKQDETTDKMADMAHEPKLTEQLKESSEFDELGGDLEGPDASLRSTRAESIGGGRFSGEEDEQFEEPEILETASGERDGREEEDIMLEIESGAVPETADKTIPKPAFVADTGPTSATAKMTVGSAAAKDATNASAVVAETVSAPEAADQTSEPGSEPDIIPGVESESLNEPLRPVEEAKEIGKSSTDTKP